jgi:hypothetical protein
VSWSFNPRYGLIDVSVRLWRGPRSAVFSFALDTGANLTVVRPEALELVGYDLSQPVRPARRTTGSGTVNAGRWVVERVESLGHETLGLVVVAHDLPAELAFDGLLGLDFFRCPNRLEIDFGRGTLGISSSSPSPPT